MKKLYELVLKRLEERKERGRNLFLCCIIDNLYFISNKISEKEHNKLRTHFRENLPKVMVRNRELLNDTTIIYPTEVSHNFEGLSNLKRITNKTQIEGRLNNVKPIWSFTNYDQRKLAIEKLIEMCND